MGMSCVCRGRIVMGEGVVWMMEVRSESVIYIHCRLFSLVHVLSLADLLSLTSLTYLMATAAAMQPDSCTIAWKAALQLQRGS